MMKIKDIYNLEDTICAISTAPGESAIGIVRLTGKRALNIADKIFIPKGGGKPSRFKDRSIHYGWIVDNSKRKTKREKLKKKKTKRIPKQIQGIIDEVLLTVMHAPKTYTRQNIVEINCHGGVLVLKKILELVLKNGARLAEPGEFTKRAFLKGRIDLIQAEAVLDVVRAKTERGLEAALGQLKGELSKKIIEIRNILIEILANLEASFDFSQEEIETLDRKKIARRLEVTKRSIEELIESAESGRIFREGVMTVICGKPNVGKSSLMNAFLKEDKVIVTPIAGTTRDVIEDIINIEGIPIRIVDTAGIIEPRDLVEREGVMRSKKCLSEADLILFMLDNSRPLSREDFQIINGIEEKPVIVIINKIDLKTKLNLEKIRDFLKNKKIIKICAIKEKGMPELEGSIKEYILGGKARLDNESILVTNLRHKRELEEGLEYIDIAIKNLEEGKGEELIAEDIKEALKFMGQMTGEVTPDEILDKIFEEFCIGK
jgi:tRNA modification GTPase